jgi:hypothetical protein
MGWLKRWIDSMGEHVNPVVRLDVTAVCRELGMSVDVASRDWRCGSCSRMQPNGAVEIWIPDSVMRHDELWSVLKAAKRFNNTSTAWCEACVAPFLRRGDLDVHLNQAREKREAARVSRLTEYGEEAQGKPSKTACAECSGTCGYRTSWSSTFSGSYQLVMCPRCGWETCEQTSTQGLTIGHGSYGGDDSGGGGRFVPYEPDDE